MDSVVTLVTENVFDSCLLQTPTSSLAVVSSLVVLRSHKLMSCLFLFSLTKVMSDLKKTDVSSFLKAKGLVLFYIWVF